MGHTRKIKMTAQNKNILLGLKSVYTRNNPSRTPTSAQIQRDSKEKGSRQKAIMTVCLYSSYWQVRLSAPPAVFEQSPSLTHHPP